MNTRLRATPTLFVLVLAGLVAPARADVTQATLQVGGPGSCSSEGFNDPGLLSDGVTVATADYAFTYDDSNGQLVLVVNNTSPVLAGVCNPVLTNIYFNTPMGVTGMTLQSQVGSGGPAPVFGFTFDSDLLSAPNPNGADGMGAYNVALIDPGGISGSIANPLADTLPGPPNSMVIGPVTFTFQLSGSLGGVSANDFVSLFSVIPPGNKPANGVGHFQGGGDSCNASAYICNNPEQCYLLIGPAAGGASWANPGPGSNSFEVAPQVALAFGTTLDALPLLPLPDPDELHLAPSMGAMGLNNAFGIVPVQEFFAQVVMWNPEVFPGNPSQSSNSLHVKVWPGGRVTSSALGTTDGMHLSHETVYAIDGQRYLRFPFQIDGL